MIALGVDAGSSTFGVVILENGVAKEGFTFETKDVRRDPMKVVRFLEGIDFDVAVGPSGLGLPVKRFSELTDRDLTLMTLSFGEKVLGLREVIDGIRRSGVGFKTYTVPGVVHMRTVPMYRKVNRVDMGTSDKLCSTALAVYELKREGLDYGDQNFVLVEAGSGFNAFIAVKGGKIVDGIGGTSGFPSFLSMGSMDGELAYLLRGWDKSLLSSGGVKSLLRDMGVRAEGLEDIPEYAVMWLSEFIAKGILAVGFSIGDEYKVLGSGKFFEEYSKEFEEFTGIRVKVLKGLGAGKRAAEGAAILADGIGGGRFKELVEWLEIMNAGGTLLDSITSDVKAFLREELRH